MKLSLNEQARFQKWLDGYMDSHGYPPNEYEVWCAALAASGTVLSYDAIKRIAEVEIGKAEMVGNVHAAAAWIADSVAALAASGTVLSYDEAVEKIYNTLQFGLDSQFTPYAIAQNIAYALQYSEAALAGAETFRMPTKHDDCSGSHIVNPDGSAECLHNGAIIE